MTKIIRSDSLGLRKESMSAPEEIVIHGGFVGARDEIVVLTHIGRRLHDSARVCHVSHGKYGEGIYDMPAFPFISVSFWENQVKTIDGIRYIMVCSAEARKDPEKYTVRPNWM